MLQGVVEVEPALGIEPDAIFSRQLVHNAMPDPIENGVIIKNVMR
jgi:hypothetical protein